MMVPGRLRRAASSNLATAAATAFIALAAVVGFALDPGRGVPDWRLRSTLGPIDEPPGPSPLPADRKPV